MNPLGNPENRARLIQKTYGVDPGNYPKCFGKMKVIISIEDEETIKRTLKNFCLWEGKPRPRSPL
jgi:hypothetical protein